MALAMAGICCDANMVGAAPSGEIYGQIPARNLFGLHEPVVQPPEPVKVQLPKVVLTGITTMGSKLAFVKIQNPSKPGEQPSEQSFILGEGQRESGIEILEINERIGTVRIINSGTEMTIGFDKDAGKIASTPPPATPPAGAPKPVAPPNIAGRIRSMNAGTSGYHRMIPTPTGQQAPGGTSTPPPGQPNPPFIQQQNPPGEKQLTPDEQAILREMEQAAQGSPQPQ